LNEEVRAQVSTSAERTAWKVLGTGSAIVAGLMVRKVVVGVWTKARHSDPPSNPAAYGTTWGEALSWTMATAIAVGVARLLATRGMAEAWRKATGNLPPGLEDVSA
jgi:hypothetical protein